MKNDKLNEIIEKAHSADTNSPEFVNDFINRTLTPEQVERFGKLLNDPQLINRLMSSDQAKQLMNRFKDKEE